MDVMFQGAVTYTVTAFMLERDIGRGIFGTSVIRMPSAKISPSILMTDFKQLA